jgi:hypothetical protein
MITIAPATPQARIPKKTKKMKSANIGFQRLYSQFLPKYLIPDDL